MADSNQQSGTRSEGEFARLFVQHESALRAFARSLLPSWELVDEAIQEASITAWTKFQDLDSPENFLPWAKVIVRFKCLSTVGKASRDKLVFSEGVLELLADEGEAILAEEQEAQIEALHTCLTKLSAPHRELIFAPYRKPGSIKALATERGRSANSLYCLLQRLREKLSACVRSQVVGAGAN